MSLKSLREKIETNRESKNLFWRGLYFVKDLLYKIARALNLRESSCPFVYYVSRRGMRVPRIFIETGTYNGGTTSRVLREFKTIHTIELSEKWYQNALKEFGKYKNVICHHGDSATVLKELLPTINEPVVFYLDAHHSGGTTAMGQDQNPLLRELPLIGARNFQDVIYIDDLAQIGKSGTMGTEGHAFYPPTPFDWRNINRDSIEKALGRKILDSEEKDNKLIIWKLGEKL
ncbi:MAG: hypothetical protein EXS48_00480 [Candidatus Staskawiczbacteria bacterium]|nr:hypothetical protein [Candidatus Staskawiczbacteria bacterium]